MYEELYAQNKGLLVKLARQYAVACRLDRAVSVEDLTQAGFLALVRAARTYDSAGGKTWASWATWYVRRACEQALCLREGRRIQAHSGADTLDLPLDADNPGSETVGDLLVDDSLPSPDAGLLLEELRREVRQAVERLADGDQRRVVQLRQLESLSFRDAARAMGISIAQARRLNARACMRLSRDWRLRRLVDLDDRTRFHAHKGMAAFNRDWTIVTEGAALWRLGQRERMDNAAPPDDIFTDD